VRVLDKALYDQRKSLQMHVVLGPDKSAENEVILFSEVITISDAVIIDSFTA
jgi:hypothetical protein